MERKRMGRPPKAADEKAGPAIQFRVRGGLKDELARQAGLAGRSISEECEFRLNRSIQNGAAAAEMFGSLDQQALIVALCNVIRQADTLSGEEPSINTWQGYAAAIAIVQGLARTGAQDVLRKASENGLGWRDSAAAYLAFEGKISEAAACSLVDPKPQTPGSDGAALADPGEAYERRSIGQIMGR